jgi:phosphoglycerol transferase MdoB-like AlkP superfamily enzyme
MIQRIQSVYFFLSALIAGVLSFFVSFYAGNEGPVMLHQDLIFMLFFLAIAALSLLALFSYKKRQTQVVYGRIAILLSFGVFGFMLYHWYAAYEADSSRLGIGVFLPLAVVVLLSMANRAVMNDDAKIRAADRFR